MCKEIISLLKEKRELIFSLFLIIAVTAFIFTKPAAELITPVPPPSLTDSFLVAGMDDAEDLEFRYLVDTLGLNLWHYYCGSTNSGGKYYPKGWTDNDTLFAPIEAYKNDILDLFQDIGDHKMVAFIQRPKIDYLCYGQRSDYQCEDTIHHLTSHNDLWFYSFQSPNPVGVDTQDYEFAGGEWVRYCTVNDQPNGRYVVSRLRTNNEQSWRDTGDLAWRNDSQCDWLIKPRIRIDSTVAHNQQNLLVCNIKVIGADGETVLKDVNIRAGNFLVDGDPPLYYNGRYLEEYNFHQDTNLTIHGDWGDNYWFSSRGNRPEGQEENKADIKVYWYGNCDMWIDYVRVDNDIADKLFKGYYEEPGREWLQWEADLACSTDVMLKFYIEKVEFNDIPCIAYVNHKLDSLTNIHCGKHIDLIADQLTFYQYHMCWDNRGVITTPEQINRQYIERIGMKQIYYGWYSLLSIEDRTKTYSRIPNTLPRHSGDSILAKDIAPNEYDAWLQGDLDTMFDRFEGGSYGGSPGGGGYPYPNPCPQQPQFAGGFQWAWRLVNKLSKLTNLPIIGDQQIHQWKVSCSEIDREPTNEELDLTAANLPVSYGAKGMILEAYEGLLWRHDSDYCVGFTETDGRSPRYLNMYHQPKWEKLKSIIKRLKTWGPALMKFDNRQTNSYIYRLERDSCLAKTFFNDVVTYKYGDPLLNCPVTDDRLAGLQSECYNYRYVQAATFKIQGDAAPYFMIINRRCSPHYKPGENPRFPDGEIGGMRYICVKFDVNASVFEGYANWNIIDIEKPAEIAAAFDKSSGSLVLLGWFEPGEGRIYKIVPGNHW